MNEEVERKETPAEMAKRLQALMPPPEEIMRMALIEAHNDEVERKRQARLEERRKRQALRGKRRKKRKK